MTKTRLLATLFAPEPDAEATKRPDSGTVNVRVRQLGRLSGVSIRFDEGKFPTVRTADLTDPRPRARCASAALVRGPRTVGVAGPGTGRVGVAEPQPAGHRPV